MLKWLGRHRPPPAMAVAVVALLVAFGGSAVADQAVDVAKRAKLIKGKRIKPRSLPGNRLRRNSVGPAEVRESRLAKVPKARLADNVADRAIGPSKIGLVPAARVESTTAVTTQSGVETVLSFDSELFDTANLHAPSSDLTRLTAPVAGVYDITGQVEWDTIGGGSRLLLIRRNDGRRIGVSLIPGATAANFVYQQVTTQAKLNAGDYVELRATQTSGSTIEIFKGGDEESQNFMMHWIGPA
jgi:hypothetical protein